MEQLTDQQITQEMQKHKIPAQHQLEGLDIIRNFLERNNARTLEEAIAFLLKWIKRLE